MTDRVVRDPHLKGIRARQPKALRTHLNAPVCIVYDRSAQRSHWSGCCWRPPRLVRLGSAYLWQKQYEQAHAEMERAIALNPNDAVGYADLAETLSRVSRSKEAVRMVEQALHLKPSVPDAHLASVGVVYSLAEQPEEAIAPLKQFLARYPNHLGPHLNLAAAYSELGKETEARAEVEEVLRLNPQFSLEVHKEHAPLVSSKGFVSKVVEKPRKRLSLSGYRIL